MTAVDRRYRITEFMRCIKEGIGFLIYHGDGEMGIFVAIVMGAMFIPLFIVAEDPLIMKIVAGIVGELSILGVLLSIPFLVMFIDAFRYCCSCHRDCAHEYKSCLDDCRDHLWLRAIGADENKCVMGCESSFYSCIYKCNHDFDP